ncbi:FliM/FliN family flagellar motor switch protein [Glaciimonas immobilis]|uniref:Surface presentation of antigens protein SpaO n=1 Tax=Glaciimonas immobilis TaxID=728004 RepID=A0A840RP88_9BURK|nr:FliM/FliN family flagellar motor switch protein [Glaciimonas immobilis]KAF3999334.1 hypothetical protein HAV38_05230 [Glaciimonas immobilis]MBB5198816.1 type III secretion protein Q [Glaciimonas immobilis]
MSFSSLRRISQASVDANRMLAHWCGYDNQSDFSPIVTTDMLIAFTAYGKDANDANWSGFLDLSAWLSHTAPALAAAARHERNGPQQVLSLFNACERPLCLKQPELDYSRIHARLVPPVNDKRCYVSVNTLQGRIWLDNFPTYSYPGDRSLPAEALDFPVKLAFLLGSSHVTRRLLCRTRKGDVLLIGNIQFELQSGAQILAHFSINETGEIAVEVLDYQEKSETFIPQEALDDIPLRIDFVLQRNLLTVAQLAALYRGQFLALDPGSEKQIEISVNGMVVGKGELVELNGQLGVEVTQISSRTKNV